jgi:LacI family transcriptional regulator
MIQAVVPLPKTKTCRARRTTLKDIAIKADLSIAAVSMALRNSSDLAPATVDRVKRIAVKMGYVPDPALAALAAYRSSIRPASGMGTIAFISNWKTRDGWTRSGNPAIFLEHAKKRAHELGYAYEHFWAPECGSSPKRLDQILQTRGIQGVILAPNQNLEDKLELDWDRYSIMCVDRPTPFGSFQFIRPDQFNAMTTCWDHLYARGYRRVGLVVQEDLNPTWRLQWNAPHIQAQLDLGITTEAIPSLAVSKDDSLETIASWLRKFKPDAVIGRCPRFAEAAALEGLRIPDDLGFVSLNVADDVKACSGIQQHWDVIGSECVNHLHRKIRNNEKGSSEVTVGIHVCGSWIQGETLPGKQARPAKHRRESVAA